MSQFVTIREPGFLGRYRVRVTGGTARCIDEAGMPPRGSAVGQEGRRMLQRTSPASNDHPTTTTRPTFRWTRRSNGAKCSAV